MEMYMRQWIMLSCLLYLFNFATAFAAIASDKNLTAEQLTQKISTLQQALAADDQKKLALSQKMHGNKQTLHKTEAQLKLLQKQIHSHQAQLQDLLKKQQMQQQQLTQQQKLLMRQIQTLYFLKKQNAMSWLLNGKALADQERFINYFHYLEKVQLLTLQTSLTQQAQICKLTQLINNQTTALQEQHKHATAIQLQLSQQQLQQQKSLLALNKKIQLQTGQLKQLIANKRALENVVSNLSTTTSTSSSKNKSFAATNGHLLWPIKGRIDKHYGAEIGQDLTSTGVVLRAKPGQAVHAVYTGKVVFADYLKGFGLLVIIDHGQGYLTLYGQNKSISTKVGAEVTTGQIIAEVGDNFGEGKFSGLYFEIRQDGRPVNPEHWCQSKPNRLFT